MDSEAPIGEMIPARTVVQVADEDGNPVPNAEVRFNVTIGNGIAAPSRTRTDSTGRASAIWRLGVVEGPQELTATLTDAQRQVRISATATPPVDNPRPGTPTNEPLESTSVTVRPQNFAVGSSHVCALDSGTLSCRGAANEARVSRTSAAATWPSRPVPHTRARSTAEVRLSAGAPMIAARLATAHARISRDQPRYAATFASRCSRQAKATPVDSPAEAFRCAGVKT